MKQTMQALKVSEQLKSEVSEITKKYDVPFTGMGLPAHVVVACLVDLSKENPDRFDKLMKEKRKAWVKYRNEMMGRRAVI